MRYAWVCPGVGTVASLRPCAEGCAGAKSVYTDVAPGPAEFDEAAVVSMLSAARPAAVACAFGMPPANARITAQTARRRTAEVSIRRV